MFLHTLRAHLEHVWAFAILAASVSFLAFANLSAPHQPGDGIGSVISLYSEAAASVPGDKPVGFLAASTESADPAIFALAQYGLAPRILTLDISATRVVVSSPSTTVALDRDPRLSGFSLHSVHRGGIRIYVRGVR